MTDSNDYANRCPTNYDREACRLVGDYLRRLFTVEPATSTYYSMDVVTLSGIVTINLPEIVGIAEKALGKQNEQREI